MHKCKLTYKINNEEKVTYLYYKDELSEKCIHAKSLLLRCAHFPLYPRLTHNEIAKIVKVLGSLP